MIILIEKLLLKEHFKINRRRLSCPVGAHCVTKDNGDLRMVVLFGNDDCKQGFLELKLQELTARRLVTKRPVCLDWSRLWVNTYIHILKTDRCTIKALPLQNYLQRRGFPAKNSDWQDWLYSCGESFEKIKDARWLVFTSKNAVAGFAYNMGECELSAGVKIAVVGKKRHRKL